MHYATNIIAIRCKFKYSTRATLNVNSARAKLNKPDKTECSAKQPCYKIVLKVQRTTVNTRGTIVIYKVYQVNAPYIGLKGL